MWTKMGPVWLLKPPPPPGPHLAKDVKTNFDKNVHQITYSILHIVELWCDF